MTLSQRETPRVESPDPDASQDRVGRLRERFPGEWGPVIVGGKLGDKVR